MPKGNRAVRRHPNLFPAAIAALPRAVLGVPGGRAHLAQGAKHQIVFMEFARPVAIPEHTHAAQWAVVLAGRIELTVAGRRRVFRRGDRYFIPAGVPHRARIFAGYADVTFFDEPGRYRVADATSGRRTTRGTGAGSRRSPKTP